MTMLTRLVKHRWLRAGAAAVALAAWPACALDHDADEGSVVAGREVPSAGAPSLEFTVPDMNGADVRLSDFLGRPVLVNFWATWCPPCKAEIPWLMEFAERYRSQRLAVVGISVDDSPEDIRRFAADAKVNYPMLVGLGQHELLEAFDASAVIPVSWFIKADGTLFAKAQGIHSKEWFENKIKAMF
jgi:cytochrome c biogenesis protein CcmG/thiol:disulfide interchange protein DsbE